jgi:hypothetical protein
LLILRDLGFADAKRQRLIECLAKKTLSCGCQVPYEIVDVSEIRTSLKQGLTACRSLTQIPKLRESEAPKVGRTLSDFIGGRVLAQLLMLFACPRCHGISGWMERAIAIISPGENP